MMSEKQQNNEDTSNPSTLPDEEQTQSNDADTDSNSETSAPRPGRPDIT